MTQEQLAFVNQQLAGMLRAGFPLERALARLCQDLRQGDLKHELEALLADLAKGVPVAEALSARRLPELYRRIVLVGVRGNDLPGALTLLADYYQQGSLLWTRLKGLMVYPLLVLVGCTALAAFVAWLYSSLAGGALVALDASWGAGGWEGRVRGDLLRLWAPVLGFGGMVLAIGICWVIPGVRQQLRWRLPGFREGALAQMAATFHLLLSRGTPLGDAVGLVQGLEKGSPAGLELQAWSHRIAQGEGKPAQFTAAGKVFPPLFGWMVCQGGEDLAAGFRRAAELFRARALYRADLVLRLALPVSVLLMGLLILAQFHPLMHVLILQLDMLGAVGD